MKTNVEIRKEVNAMLANGWFGRLFIAFFSLYSIFTLVMGLLIAMYDDMSLQTWEEFMKAKMIHAMQGLDYAVPSVDAAFRMSGATLFQQFVACLFLAILLFGMARMTLKAVRNDVGGWYSSSFGGFSRPLELTWLIVRMNVQVFLWSLLFVIPGVVAIYRYRQAWYLKSENPGWSAGKCLAASGDMMKGCKWQAFCLDLYYAVWALVIGALMNLLNCVPVPKAVAFVGCLFMMYFLVRLACAMMAARATFYRELSESIGGNEGNDS